MRPLQQITHSNFLSSYIKRDAISKITRHAVSSSATSSAPMSEADEDLVRKQALSLLRQKRQILKIISADHYTTKVPTIFNSSVASHLRHILDHYMTAVAAATTTETAVNYDERKRDTDIEKSKDAAVEAIEKLEQELLSVELLKPTRVSFYGDTETFQSFQMPTTVGREIAFASHHAIHHLSMVKLIMQDLKYEFPDDSTIGIAPSTVKDKKQTGKL